jgi:hypothetical protein
MRMILAVSQATKRLTENLGRVSKSAILPNDMGTSEVEKGRVVVHLLFLPNQDTSETVHPTMSPLADPSAGSVTMRFKFFFSSLRALM